MSVNEAETRARTMGWLPKEQYKGKEENWLPAEAYIERGEHILPILQANNKKLTDRLSAAEAELQSNKQLLAASQEAIEELKNFTSQINKDKVKDKKAEVTAALVQAKKDGNVEAEVELTAQLSEVTTALKEAEKAPVKKESTSQPTGPQLTEAAKEWSKENPWFGTENRKTAYALGLRQEWVASGKTAGTKEMFDFVDEELAKVFDPNSQRRDAASRVDTTSSSTNGGGKSKTFADLPPEAKEACEKFGKKLVGPGRAYKTQEDWRKAYVAKYDWT